MVSVNEYTGCQTPHLFHGNPLTDSFSGCLGFLSYSNFEPILFQPP